MSDVPVLDPEMAALAAALSDPSAPSIENRSPAEVRHMLAAFLPTESPDLFDIRDDVIARATAPDLLARIYAPVAEPAATILFFHGGGWVVGSIDDYDYFVRHLALATGCRVVSVEYRLAPESRFPAAVEDAWAAFEAYATPYGPLFLAGDSAGGNLAAVVAQKARDDGMGAVAGQLLFYPSVAGDIDAPSLSAFIPPALPRSQIAAFFDHYVPNAADRTDIRFAPTLAPSLKGLAPALVVTAEADLLAAEAEDYAARMAAAGVSVQLHRQRGAIHTYLTLGTDFAASRETLAVTRDFVVRHLPTDTGTDVSTSHSD